MTIYQLVIDTNILIAGLRSNKGASYKLLSILNDPRWRINLSTALVFEYETVLKRESEQLNLSFNEIDKIINALCSIANLNQIFFLWRPLSKDPDDDFLFDLAVKSQANFIISYNKSDLKAIEKFGVEVLTPKEFLQRVGEI